MSNIVITATKFLDVEAGHRLIRHESKCKNYHGHHYRFEITCFAMALDDVGRVIDFSDIKRYVGSWLDSHWDHAMIVEQGDELIPHFVRMGMKHFVMPSAPTAENLALYVLQISRVCLPPHISVQRVRCHETPTCYADAIAG